MLDYHKTRIYSSYALKAAFASTVSGTTTTRWAFNNNRRVSAGIVYISGEILDNNRRGLAGFHLLLPVRW